MDQLHVLNGDATLEIFRKTAIQGDTLVWREVLVEGKVTEAVGSALFWQERAAFFEGMLETDKNVYQTLTIQEFERLKNFPDYKEVTLWFEYDLFCQINLMALLSWFCKQKIRKTRISMVCAGDVAGYSGWVALGTIKPEAYPILFGQRVALSGIDLQYADLVWKVFCASNPVDLIPFATKNMHPKFPYLPAALKAHLKRFPSVRNGLNDIEKQMLTLVQDGKISEKEVVRDMLKKQNFYGFGDLQYALYLKQLNPLFKTTKPLALNQWGEKILANQADLLALFPTQEYLGGTLKRAYRWDHHTENLVKA